MDNWELIGTVETEHEHEDWPMRRFGHDSTHSAVAQRQEMVIGTLALLW